MNKVNAMLSIVNRWRLKKLNIDNVNMKNGNSNKYKKGIEDDVLLLAGPRSGGTMRLKDQLNEIIQRENGEFTTDDADKVGAGAIKYDGGKVPVYRGAISYFPTALRAVAEISWFGARKYAWAGWRGVDDGINRYTDGLCRHLLAESEGELRDPDSELLHAAHVAWNALARLELIIEEQKKLDRDS